MELDGHTKQDLRNRVGITKESSTLLPLNSLATIESLTIPPVQEVVISADVRCNKCQKRVNAIISRTKETESVVVNLLEKKVIVTYRCSGGVQVSSKQIPSVYNNPLAKFALVKRIFGFSSR
ncbi:hypothetical protein Ancab_018544 [Ancistrocladus abbreviatus]